MRHHYIKDFVNVRYWVSLDFEKLITEEVDDESCSNWPRIMIAAVMAAVTLFCLIKLWLFAFAFGLMLVSFALLMKWLQSKMDVKFSQKFIWLTMLILFGATMISMGVALHLDNIQQAKIEALAEQQRQAEIAEKIEQQRIAKEKEQERLNNFAYYVGLANGNLEDKNTIDAIQNYKMALSFADAVGISAISYKIANLLFLNKKYNEAMEYYSKVQNNPSRLDTLHYNQAICFVNAGEIGAAVYMLQQSIRTSRVEALFNKINPIKTRVAYVDKPVQKKRVAYYTIMCRDGSTSSSSSRRGTCSRHGGVSDWQHPVYETYTENQKKKVVEKYREYGEL